MLLRWKEFLLSNFITQFISYQYFSPSNGYSNICSCSHNLIINWECELLSAVKKDYAITTISNVAACFINVIISINFFDFMALTVVVIITVTFITITITISTAITADAAATTVNSMVTKLHLYYLVSYLLRNYCCCYPLLTIV